MLLKLLISAVIIAFIIISILKPKIAFMMSIFFLFNGFGFLSWLFNEFGYSKSIDYAYIMAVLSIVSSGLRKDKEYFQKNNILLTVIVFFTIYLIFQFFYTVLRYDQSTYLTFATGRQYIGFLFFLPTILFLNLEDVNVKRYMGFIFVTGIAGSVLYIVYNFFDIVFLDFMFKTQYQDIGYGVQSTYIIKRVYGGMDYPIYMIEGTLFAYLLENQIKKYKFFYWSMFALFVFSVLITYGRGTIMGMAVVIAIVAIFNRIKIYKKLVFVLIAFIFTLITITLFSYKIYDDPNYLTDTFISRILQAETDIRSNEGTYKLRSDLVADRWRLVEDNPVIGAGMVHPASGLYRELDGIIGSGHNGYIQILAQFGYTGMVFLVIITALIFYYAYRLTRLNAPFHFRAIAQGTMGYVVAGYFNMMSASSFISAQSICTMGILIGMIYYCHQNYGEAATDQDQYSEQQNLYS